MDIFINNNKADIILENEKTLQDVLVGIESECAKVDATIIGVNIDDVDVSADELNKRFTDLIENTKKLSITTVCKTDIKSYFIAVNGVLTDLKKKLPEIPVLLQSGKDGEAAETVKEFAEAFNNFCRAVSLSSLFPESFGTTKEKAVEISEFLSDITPILNDLEGALEQKDTVLIGDLSEYEILPRINTMKDFCIDFSADVKNENQ